jgi:hypothetical protein
MGRAKGGNGAAKGHCKCRSPVGPVPVRFVVTRFESGMPTTSSHLAWPISRFLETTRMASWSLVAPVLWS